MLRPWGVKEKEIRKGVHFFHGPIMDTAVFCRQEHFEECPSSYQMRLKRPREYESEYSAKE
ncbi:hypothetical protein Bealeia1_01631 [Candidatus Bealeia paramacronuclearis]|uniref:Uncharacterized protein n=1 Tax=Candidatus Bealeia paramacronuclearis TaxID=1921001 RepID=A0ABZ2C7D4_9PROT|nr:hypothetical protein [Candidatus Bealeia paramacronuclearis]